MQDVLTKEEIAAKLKVSENSISAMVQRGEFIGVAFRVGRQWRFSVAALEKWMDQRARLAGE